LLAAELAVVSGTSTVGNWELSAQISWRGSIPGMEPPKGKAPVAGAPGKEFSGN
jgi:hypothetical protein